MDVHNEMNLGKTVEEWVGSWNWVLTRALDKGRKLRLAKAIMRTARMEVRRLAASRA